MASQFSFGGKVEAGQQEQVKYKSMTVTHKEGMSLNLSMNLEQLLEPNSHNEIILKDPIIQIESKVVNDVVTEYKLTVPTSIPVSISYSETKSSDGSTTDQVEGQAGVVDGPVQGVFYINTQKKQSEDKLSVRVGFRGTFEVPTSTNTSVYLTAEGGVTMTQEWEGR
jgi:hypothetical protein